MNAERFLVEYLSPTRREALKPPFPAPGRGAGGLGQSVNLKLYNVFRRCLILLIPPTSN